MDNPCKDWKISTWVLVAAVVALVLAGIICLIVYLVKKYCKSSYEPSQFLGGTYDSIQRPKQYTDVGKFQRDTMPPIFNISRTGASVVTDGNTPGYGISEGIANTALAQQLSANNLKKFSEDRLILNQPMTTDQDRFVGNYEDINGINSGPMVKQVLPHSNYGTSRFNRESVIENLTMSGRRV